MGSRQIEPMEGNNFTSSQKNSKLSRRKILNEAILFSEKKKNNVHQIIIFEAN